MVAKPVMHIKNINANNLIYSVPLKNKLKSLYTIKSSNKGLFVKSVFINISCKAPLVSFCLLEKYRIIDISESCSL